MACWLVGEKVPRGAKPISERGERPIKGNAGSRDSAGSGLVADSMGRRTIKKHTRGGPVQGVHLSIHLEQGLDAGTEMPLGMSIERGFEPLRGGR